MNTQIPEDKILFTDKKKKKKKDKKWYLAYSDRTQRNDMCKPSHIRKIF